MHKHVCVCVCTVVHFLVNIFARLMLHVFLEYFVLVFKLYIFNYMCLCATVWAHTCACVCIWVQALWRPGTGPLILSLFSISLGLGLQVSAPAATTISPCVLGIHTQVPMTVCQPPWWLSHLPSPATTCCKKGWSHSVSEIPGGMFKCLKVPPSTHLTTKLSENRNALRVGYSMEKWGLQLFSNTSIWGWIVLVYQPSSFSLSWGLFAGCDCNRLDYYHLNLS